MNLVDYILIIIILIIISLIVTYIIISKKKGQKCIGCPYSKTCGKTQCSCNKNQKNI